MTTIRRAVASTLGILGTLSGASHAEGEQVFSEDPPSSSRRFRLLRSGSGGRGLRHGPLAADDAAPHPLLPPVREVNDERRSVRDYARGVAGAPAAGPLAHHRPDIKADPGCVQVTVRERMSAPRSMSPALDQVSITKSIAIAFGYDGSAGTEHTRLTLPPLPVYAFLAPEGSLLREDMVLLNSGPPNDRDTSLSLRPGQYDPDAGDLIVLSWSETEGVATPWAELYQGEDQSFKLRAVPPPRNHWFRSRA